MVEYIIRIVRSKHERSQCAETVGTGGKDWKKARIIIPGNTRKYHQNTGFTGINMPNTGCYYLLSPFGVPCAPPAQSAQSLGGRRICAVSLCYIYTLRM
jgi:hypothetical protein